MFRRLNPEGPEGGPPILTALLRPARRCVLAGFAAAVLVAIAGLLPAGPDAARASRAQESIFQDDRALYYQGAAGQVAALDTMAGLGVDTVHTVARWRFFVPRIGGSKPPRHFDGRNPASYPASRWNVLDDIVRGAQARGMQVLISPSAPAPDWASTCSGKARRRHRGTCRPDPRLFGQFVQALGRRYSGTYRDESDGQLLPRVSRWSVWNEPNLSSWLYPQLQSVRGQSVVVGAAVYRNLVYAATAGLRAAGHSRDQVLLGETAPLGNRSSQVAPARFYRALFCVDSRGHRLTGATASASGCSHRPRRLAVTGVAHHPYTRGAGTSFFAKVGPDDITIAGLSRLSAVMRLGARAGAVPRSLASSIYLTEFGVSSKPPGTRYSVPLLTQAKWINEADYIAYRNPNVRSVAQYELADDHSYSRNYFQTGLCFDASPCDPKLSFRSYRVPLYVVRHGKSVIGLRGARPADTGMAEQIDIQHDDGQGNFNTVRTVKLNRAGWFTATMPNTPGLWRLAWIPAGGGATFVSRQARAETR